MVRKKFGNIWSLISSSPLKGYLGRKKEREREREEKRRIESTKKKIFGEERIMVSEVMLVNLDDHNKLNSTT